ncbi:alpha/beta hydrolase [Pontibacillus chungwhensis BH030062]|uniref:Alpha/beta hydrolase n=1 Tax=Pontibacillus chungwhensis BH030062 TaxID=1385513 RepID=A0A0A2UZI6_9BACI|nr:alpha/beta fold hydrolase [Pontibacillus chungwhensis]KGP92203.1 alpha/beta hydrolase [Pontibacillus chungwhensis BH030062]
MLKKFSLMALGVMLVILAACSDEDKKEESPPEDKEETVKAEEVVGTWNGEIEVPDGALQIIVEFNKDEELNGTIDIPKQQIEDFGLENIELNGDGVKFQMPLSGTPMTFDGTVEGDTISGTFVQSGQSFPFTLEKGKGTSDPKANKDETFLSIETEMGTLTGALMTPDNQSEFPVVLIIPGSGPTTRDGNSAQLPGENDSLLKIAESLKEEGIASLRYDKRGAGKNASVINEADLRFDQFVDDASLWIEKLGQDDRFTSVGVIGHSQGSLVGMLSAKDSEAGAYVSLAGVGRSFDKALLDQLQRALPGELYEESKRIVEEIKKGEVVKDIPESLQSTFRPSVQPFLRSWMEYDPAKQIQELSIPTLIVSGTHDLQVPPKEAEMLAEAQPEAELLEIEGMNHVLKDAPKDREGNLKAYEDPEIPLAEGLMAGIVTFLKDHLN